MNVLYMYVHVDMIVTYCDNAYCVDVHGGSYKGMQVAIKTIKDGYHNAVALSEFIREAALMT